MVLHQSLRANLTSLSHGLPWACGSLLPAFSISSKRPRFRHYVHSNLFCLCNVIFCSPWNLFPLMGRTLLLDLHSPPLHFQSTHSLDQRPWKPWESIKDSRVSREPGAAMEVTLAGVWLRISAPPVAEFTRGLGVDGTVSPGCTLELLWEPWTLQVGMLWGRGPYSFPELTKIALETPAKTHWTTGAARCCCFNTI